MAAVRPQLDVAAPVPALARFLVFDMWADLDPRPALTRLRDARSASGSIFGVGQPLVRAAGANLEGLRAMPALAGPGAAFPSTQGALWAFLPGGDASELHDRALAVARALGDGFLLKEEVHAFRYREGRDLSGYVDGTANPSGDAARGAAIVSARGAGLDGSTFVAAQRYVHDLNRFNALPQKERDHIIGRRLSDNEELEDAPPFAHVKRSEQESFDPPAFMLRRSMPWGGFEEHGLYFVAFGQSLDRFERVLSRMAGLDDGVADGLLRFTRPLSGGYYWCPPLSGERLDWSALGV